MVAKKLRIKLVRSTNGISENQAATIKALGLKKIGSYVEQKDNVQIQGMINKVAHLVEVEKL